MEESTKTALFTGFALICLTYLDPDPNSKHMGETRETRIKEFHVYNDNYVVGLREGAMLHINGDTVTLKGTTGARIFYKNIRYDS